MVHPIIGQVVDYLDIQYHETIFCKHYISHPIRVWNILQRAYRLEFNEFSGSMPGSIVGQLLGSNSYISELKIILILIKYILDYILMLF